MVTIFDLMAILMPVLGIAVGAGLGSDHGIAWGIVGGLAGGVIGLYLGRLPTLIMLHLEKRKLAPLSSDEIRNRLHDPKCWTPNFLLLELRSRGEDIRPELPHVLNLMESEVEHYRMKGFAALLSAFPEIARLSKGYNPMHSVEKCREKITDLRLKAEQSAAPLPSAPQTGPSEGAR